MEQAWWINHEARDLMAIGLTNEACQELGELLFVDVALVGTRLKVNDSLVTIEAKHMITDLKSPVDGIIVAVNPRLEGRIAPNTDANQWLLKVQPLS